MPAHSNLTKKENLFIPQVIADDINAKLTNYIKFTPLCYTETLLAGIPGDTITLPSFSYIGDAEDVAEGQDINIVKLNTSKREVTIKKAGKGVELSDESVLSGYGDPMGQAVNQLALSVANKVDNDVLAVLEGITGNMLHSCTAAITADEIAKALVKFGEDIDGDKVLLVEPDLYGELVKAKDWLPASEVAANIMVNGVVGMIYGCQVIVTNKLKGKKTAYIVKPNAVAIFLKRETLVETDRDIVAKTTVVTADKHYVAYLYDESKVIKIKGK